jgi:membrane protease YdiL (CAAX protease family)
MNGLAGTLVAWAPRSALGLPGFVEGGWGVAVKVLIPVVGFALVLPVLWLFFRRTWRELDAEAADFQAQRRAARSYDVRPLVLFTITALVLTLQEYYGGRDFYRYYLYPALRRVEIAQIAEPGGLGQYVDTRFYGELYSYGWWAFTRIAGYTALPILAWKAIFPRDSLLDMGLRTRGFARHAWIYVACLLVVVPMVVIASQSPDFANYYPFYKQCSRSWFDLMVWESMYIAQFFALELFFRGFWLVPLRRTMGSGAIFAMCVPYVMIHYGKPYLESAGAFVAGVFLGSLAMRTRSIYSGFLVHMTVALLMDGLALAYGPGLPTQLWPR